MPLHDWKKVNPGLFHHFHQGWCWEIGRALNQGRLPEGFSALVEQRSGTKEPDVLAIEEKGSNGNPFQGEGGTALLARPQTKIIQESDKEYYAKKASRIAIRHKLGTIVALIEIVSPGNKHDRGSMTLFVDKIVEAIQEGIHVLVIDPFPPSPRDPLGIHQVIWDHFEPDDVVEIPRQARIFASYEAGDVKTAFVEPIEIGDAIPDMPLFIARGAHIPVPLEETYQAALSGSPKPVRTMVGA